MEETGPFRDVAQDLLSSARGRVCVRLLPPHLWTMVLSPTPSRGHSGSSSSAVQESPAGLPSSRPAQFFWKTNREDLRKVAGLGGDCYHVAAAATTSCSPLVPLVSRDHMGGIGAPAAKVTPALLKLLT